MSSATEILTLTCLASLALGACVDEPGEPGRPGDDPWVDTAIPEPSVDDPTTDALPGDGGEADDGEADDGEAEFIEVVWEGGGVVGTDSTYNQAWGEAIVAGYDDDDTETLLCVVGWSVTMVSALDDCADCEFAFEIEHGEVEVEVDEDGACAEYGIDTASITGQRAQIGYRPGELLEQRDGAWVPAGEAQYDSATGELLYERADESDQ